MKPNYKYFKCKEHGVVKESGCFPDTVGVLVDNIPGKPRTRFCTRCFYEMMVRECFKLEEMSEQEVEEHKKGQTIHVVSSKKM